MQKKNLIAGTIWNYSYIDLEPFLKTLRATDYDGDILFFYNNVDTRTLQRLRKEGVFLIPFTSTSPYLDELGSENKWRDIPGMKNLNFICFRFLLYYCYLKRFGEKYQKVFLVDVRDMLFQHDPFDFDSQPLSCFTERDGLALKDSGANCKWVEESFGPGAIANFGDQPVLCAGTTMGTTSEILNYLEIYFDTLSAHPSPKTVNDQGLHNYVIYTYLRSRATIYKNNVSTVLTLGLEDTVPVRKDGTILNQDGSVPFVVHQYDRHYWLAKRYYSPQLRMKLFWQEHLMPSKVASRIRYRIARSILFLFKR